MLPLIRKIGCFVLGCGFGLYIYIPWVIREISEDDLKTIEILSPFVLIFCGILLNGTYTKDERLKIRADRELKIRNLRRKFGHSFISRLENLGWCLMVFGMILWGGIVGSHLKHFAYFAGITFVSGYTLVFVLSDHHKKINIFDVFNIYSKPTEPNRSRSSHDPLKGDSRIKVDSTN